MKEQEGLSGGGQGRRRTRAEGGVKKTIGSQAQISFKEENKEFSRS